MLILKERDVYTLLSDISVQESHRLLSALHDVLRSYSADQAKRHAEASEGGQIQIHQPERSSIVTSQGNTSLFMPSSITTSTAVKVVTISAGGLKGCVNVFAPEGELLGVLNAEEVTAFRTSLAVMIPFVRWVKVRARARGEGKGKGKKNLVVFGAGRQAMWHVRLALLLGDVGAVTVVNRNGARKMEDVFVELRPSYPDVSFDVLLKTEGNYESQLQDYLAKSDVIFCCTPSTTPHFPHRYLTSNNNDKPRFISLIGSYKPSMHEVDTETLLSGNTIYVDTKEGCLVEAGELITAGVTEDQLTEIGELPLCDEDDDEQFPGKDEGNKNLIFKCVGLGIMDLVMAGELLEMAKVKGMGLVVDDF